MAVDGLCTVCCKHLRPYRPALNPCFLLLFSLDLGMETTSQDGCTERFIQGQVCPMYGGTVSDQLCVYSPTNVQFDAQFGKLEQGIFCHEH